MRSRKDRRKTAITVPHPVVDDDLGGVLSDRRKHSERRIENLALEERQTLLAEMPGLPSRNDSDKDS